jgi:thioredoxin-dependent peroxiredoxin
MLKTGDRAPAFDLPDQDGNRVTLSDLLSEGPLLLYFYPADFTPGCTKEACEIRDMHEDICDVGIRVVGVSPQDEASHTRFRQRHNLPFTLLADADKQAVKAYGVDGPLGIGVRRATFLINTEGVIEDVVLADLLIGRHSDFIRQAVAHYRG